MPTTMTRIHERADGGKIEFRAAIEPGFIRVECRVLQNNGYPFTVDGGKWDRITGDGWAWFDAVAPDIYAEMREASAGMVGV